MSEEILEIVKETNTNVREMRRRLEEIASQVTMNKARLDGYINRDDILRKRVFVLFSGLFCVLAGFLLKTYF